MKSITHIRFLLIGMLSVVVFSSTLWADMYVDRSIVIFPPASAPRQDVKVTNSGDETMYIQVDVLKVSDPGSKKEERVKVTDPKELKLLATPNKLVIPPGGEKLIRIVNLDTKSAVERVYRINVTPIVPPLEDNVSQLRIVVAYQILTIVHPSNPESKLDASRSGRKILFNNNGNSNLLLSEGRQCDLKKPEQCETLESRRLYAGNSWELELPFDASLSYSVRDYDGIKKLVIP